MTNQLRFTTGDLETGEFNLDVAIDSKKGNTLDAMVDAIKMLIRNIDLKHTCDEDYDLYLNAMKKILGSVVVSLVCEGWGDGDFENENMQRTLIGFLKEHGIATETEE